MIDVVEITLNEFKEDIYAKYIRLFPEDEQRDWEKIERTYKNGIEKFYKILLKDITIGFFMLEKISDNYPFYIDYFAIFNEFQNKGYGTKAMQILENKITDSNGLIAEIEKENINNPITIRRFEFYKRLGFNKIGSEYLLYDVLYTPIININKIIDKRNMDIIFFDYYKTNCGELDVKTKCKIIK